MKVKVTLFISGKVFDDDWVDRHMLYDKKEKKGV